MAKGNPKELIRSGEVSFSAWKELWQATADYKAGKNISRYFSSAKEAIDYLNT